MDAARGQAEGWQEGWAGRTIAQAPAREGIRFNDAAVDPAGRVWVGSMDIAEKEPLGVLYRLEQSGALTPVVTGVTVSNGIGWSPNGGTMYLSDSGTATIDAFDFDGVTGAISRRRTLVHIDQPGMAPDGLTVDGQGDIWVGMYNGWGVHRYAPDGSLRGRVDIPVAQATSCAFGGPDRRTLFVTTGRERLDEAAQERQPDAGRVFSVTGLDARGPGCVPYRGAVPDR